MKQKDLTQRVAARKEKDRVAKIVRAKLLKDYSDVFSTPAGVRVLNDLISMTHQFHPSFSFSGANQSDFREGERNIGLMVIKKVNAANQDALFRAFKINLEKEYVK